MLEQFLKRVYKRRALIEERRIPLEVLKDALAQYLQPFHSTESKEIIDVDIVGLTKDQDIKIYWR